MTEGYVNPTESTAHWPVGRYDQSPMAQGSDTLDGTGAYWSGLWDHDDGQNETNGKDVDVDVYGENYGAYLVVNDNRLEGATQFYQLQKTNPE